MFADEEVWHKSILVFDSCSILRLCEWCKKKSLELKDIFDCKTEEIILLEQVRKEISNVYSQRFEQEKYKYIKALIFVSQQENKEKAITSLKKQCEGKKYSKQFFELLHKYIQGEIEYSEAMNIVMKIDTDEKLSKEDESIELIINNFFINIFPTGISEDKLQERYLLDSNKKLPGWKDKSKEVNQKGDYIILNQLVEMANKKDKDIIFITADVKSDWFIYNKENKQREFNPIADEWFQKHIDNNSKITVITLSDMLVYANKFVNSDLSALVRQQTIYELIEENYDLWYPVDLMEKVNEYIEENNIMDEVQDAVQHCVDCVEFGEKCDYTVKDITYEIDGDTVIVKIFIEFIVDLDTSAHVGGEDIELESVMCYFSSLVKGEIPISWKSDNTEAISLESQLDNIEIEYVDFISADNVYDEEEPEYDEEYSEYDEEEPEYDEEYIEYDEEEPEYDEEYIEYDEEEPEYDEEYPEYDEE